MKKVGGLIIILLLLFSLFLYWYFRPTNYELNYQVNNFPVKEKYDKEKKAYFLEITYQKQKFNYVLSAKYTHQRKLITNVALVKDIAEATCIAPESKYLNVYDLCLQDGELTTKNVYLPDPETKVQKEYNNIKIYDYNAKTYLLWNYHNYIYLDAKKSDLLKLFAQDIYSLKLVYATSKYLFIPDQTNEYTFDNYYLIDAEKGKIKNIKLTKEIYFDSYILGTEKNNLYLVDRKNKQEYKINLTKGQMTKIDGQVLVNDKWEKVSITKLINEDYAFKNDTLIEYVVADQNLYAEGPNLKIRLSNKAVNKIVGRDQDGIYYLAGDALYYFSFPKGEVKLLSYSEWNFNFNNMVYVFD